jgi:hypothetical protein
MKDRWDLLNNLGGSLADVLRRRLNANDPLGFDSILLGRMVGRADTRYYFRTDEVQDLISFAKVHPATQAQINAKMSRADAILAHRFPEQVNSADYTVQLPAGEIDWDQQPATTTNPNFLHSLNRHTYWTDLAIAYRSNGDRRYIRELISQLVSWSKQSKPPTDANKWPTAGPMWNLLNAADRADKWVLAYFLVLGTPGWTPEANTIFLRGLWQHGNFLSAAIPGKLNRNRAILQASGLLNIATLFPEFKQASSWAEQADDWMFRSLQVQFYPDGGHFEESPSYDGIAVAAFLDKYYLGQLNGSPAWRRANRMRLTNAIEAYYQFASPGAVLPAVSDTFRATNPAPLLDRAAVVFGDPRYAVTQPGLEDLLLLGVGGFTAAQSYFSGPKSGPGPGFALPDTGYYMLRSTTGGTPKLTFDAGPKGGAHGHYDLLNFELDLGSLGRGIADPGPFGYDNSALRQWAISTPAHNTISIDGLNHAAVEGAHNPKIVVDDFHVTNAEARITAHHYAYAGFAGSPVVGRSIWFNPSQYILSSASMLVVDWGRSGQFHPHAFTTSLTFPAATVSQIQPGVVEYTINGAQKLRVQTLLLPGQTTALENRTISTGAPPKAGSPAVRYAVSQTTTAPLFVNFVSVYTYFGRGGLDGTVPHDPPIASWEAPARRGQPVRIRITNEDGTFQIVNFDLPALDPLSTQTTAASLPPQGVPPSAPLFSAPDSAPSKIFNDSKWDPLWD